MLGTLATTEPGRSRWSPATGTCSSWSTTPSRYGAVLRPRRGQPGGLDDAAVRAKYGVTGRAVRGLRGACAATQRRSARSARRRREDRRPADRQARLDWPAILAALDDPAAGFAPGVRTKLLAATRLPGGGAEGGQRGPGRTLPDLDLSLPRAGPVDPDRLLELAEQATTWPARSGAWSTRSPRWSDPAGHRAAAWFTPSTAPLSA